ncbi:MAG: Lrp/AsnC family transcriptional regulator [Candidatus Bathyarchaeota archaeon]|nr:Lrp/AsnC family transcriptional regulator [Candidatus Bathyarchaeota archaeon]
MGIKLDDLDFKIVRQLQRDGRVSITDLANAVGSSRPTVTNRLRQLLNDGVVVVRGGLDLSGIGFKVACVGLEVRDDEGRREVERVTRGCPRVVGLFRTPEKANVFVGLWGEDERTVNSVIESYRDMANADVVYAHYLGTPVHGDQLIGVGEGGGDQAPCGKDCGGCHRYESGWCAGCPATTHYRNPLLK